MLVRTRVDELMDDPELSADLHEAALRDLAKLNSISMSASMIWSEIYGLYESRPEGAIRILDLATGGGDVPAALAKRSVSKGIPIEILALDISETAVNYARSNTSQWRDVIRFEKFDVVGGILPLGFDVVMTSLFTHHLDPPQVVALLSRMKQAATRLVLVNDLVRSPISLAMVRLGTKVLSKSPIVQFDGPASVNAAFTRAEMREMAEEAGLTDCRVIAFPPCRQLVSWRRSV